MKTRSMISFDWAMKRLLRNKANFEVLEGFLSELLRRKIIIKHIGDGESKQEDETDKFNKVDILVEADDRELVIIELQYDSEKDYFQRMLYGVSKAITEHIDTGDKYSIVRKVYSINIVYFDLGKGDDYVYHGVHNFKGLHTNNELKLTAAQHQLYGKTFAGDLYPEYYIIKVRGFDDVAKNTLDEWIYYFKNNKIGDDFTAQGINKAREVLAFDNLNEEEKRQYLRNIENKRISDSVIETSYEEGHTKGEVTGLEKGRAEGEAERARLKNELEAAQAEKEAAQAEKEAAQAEKENSLKTMVINCHLAGLPLDTISTITGLTRDQIADILKQLG
jgi:predicted transposase/invertase (TIGR01784 family)